jgi:flagellar biosynthetic protein FliP
MKRFLLAALVLAGGAAGRAFGAPPRPAISIPGITGNPAAGAGIPMQIILMLTALTLLPAAVMSMTPFLRLTVVFHFLRQALGTQTVPSNQVLVGLSLFLTLLIMQPVASDIYRKAW